MQRIEVRIGGGATKVGTLLFDQKGQKETSAFTYERDWLENPRAFPIAPSMPLREATFYTTQIGNASSLPGPIADSTPDSWGREVIKMKRGGGHLTDFDYLIESDDFLRSGALRYFEGENEQARPVASGDGIGEASVPRLYDLSEVIAQARAFEADPERYREKRAKMVGGDILANAVGSLGGARPKVNARAEDGSLWIVKLAKMDDTHDIARSEVLALDLARRVGIDTAAASILQTSQKYPVALIKRFDRMGPDGTIRIPFISAQTFMDLPGTEPSNYVDIAQALQLHSSDPRQQMRELYKRLLFSILIQNTDDHLRNHGLLLDRHQKWSLSPAYDINPTPDEGVTLKTAISEIHGNVPDIALAIEASVYFDMSEDDAREIVVTMASTINDEWRQRAAELKMGAKDMARIAPAFENGQMAQALALSRTSGYGG
jgi:serine/threonine-protein kinase HipA